MKIKCAHKVDLDSKINKIVKDKVAQDMKSLLEDMEPYLFLFSEQKKDF